MINKSKIKNKTQQIKIKGKIFSHLKATKKLKNKIRVKEKIKVKVK